MSVIKVERNKFFITAILTIGTLFFLALEVRAESTTNFDNELSDLYHIETQDLDCSTVEALLFEEELEQLTLSIVEPVDGDDPQGIVAPPLSTGPISICKCGKNGDNNHCSCTVCAQCKNCGGNYHE